MLFYKAWLDTRWRFAIGLAVLLGLAMVVVFGYEEIRRLLPEAAKLGAGSALGREIAAQAALVRDYRSYIWSQWIYDDMRQLCALLAVVIGAGGVLSQSSRGGGMFMLSLPASRAMLVWARVAVGLGELFVLAMAPMLAIAALSPLVGQQYAIGDALVHGVLMFVGSAVLFAATTMLASQIREVWLPPVLVLCATVFFQLIRVAGGLPESYSLLALMTGEARFMRQPVPVAMLALAVLATAVWSHAATRRLAHQDF